MVGVLKRLNFLRERCLTCPPFAVAGSKPGKKPKGKKDSAVFASAEEVGLLLSVVSCGRDVPFFSPPQCRERMSMFTSVAAFCFLYSLGTCWMKMLGPSLTTLG